MTTPIVAFGTTGALSNSAKTPASRKKRVLLVDTCRSKRDVRAETMRRLGAEVDCAANISEARAWWKPDLYDLVLLHVEDEAAHWDRFCDDVRSATPRQQIAFLVGKPEYVAGLPKPGNGASVAPAEHPGLPPPPSTTVTILMSGDEPQHWGILEACRRISAVRAVANARSRAIRDRPLPPRDLETTAHKRSQLLQSQVFAEIDRKETR